MSNSSLAAQAVANGPMSAAPPSFDGHGWLVVVNLAGMTTCTLIAVMVLLLLATDTWRFRRKERETGMTAARVWRRIGLLYAMGVALRSAGAAWVLWRWNPLDPAATGQALLLQRILDPAALVCAVAGLGLYVISLPGMLEKLRRKPPPVKMWQEHRMLWRIGADEGDPRRLVVAQRGVASRRESGAVVKLDRLPSACPTGRRAAAGQRLGSILDLRLSGYLGSFGLCAPK